jgi:hypothetical protein
MPWFKIPPDKLEHLSLFGIDLIADQGEFAWYRGTNGRMRVEKADPRIFFEDVSEAHQCGATAVMVSVRDD